MRCCLREVPSKKHQHECVLSRGAGFVNPPVTAQPSEHTRRFAGGVLEHFAFENIRKSFRAGKGRLHQRGETYGKKTNTQAGIRFWMPSNFKVKVLSCVPTIDKRNPMSNDDTPKSLVRQEWKRYLREDGAIVPSSPADSPPIAPVPHAEASPRRSRPSAAKSVCIIVGMILAFVVIVFAAGQTGKDSKALDSDGKNTQAESARNREGRRPMPIARELRGQR